MTMCSEGRKEGEQRPQMLGFCQLFMFCFFIVPMICLVHLRTLSLH